MATKVKKIGRRLLRHKGDSSICRGRTELRIGANTRRGAAALNNASLIGYGCFVLFFYLKKRGEKKVFACHRADARGGNRSPHTHLQIPVLFLFFLRA